MNRFMLLLPAVALAIGVAAAEPPRPPAKERGVRPAPEFPTRDPALWINSAPLSMSGLRGRVVLIDVWTFG
jgi:hypothetical protein